MTALLVAVFVASFASLGIAACPGESGSSGPREGCFECPPNPSGVPAPKSGAYCTDDNPGWPWIDANSDGCFDPEEDKAFPWYWWAEACPELPGAQTCFPTGDCIAGSCRFGGQACTQDNQCPACDSSINSKLYPLGQATCTKQSDGKRVVTVRRHPFGTVDIGLTVPPEGEPGNSYFPWNNVTIDIDIPGDFRNYSVDGFHDHNTKTSLNVQAANVVLGAYDGPTHIVFQNAPDYISFTATDSCIVGGDFYDGSPLSEIRVNNASSVSKVILNAPGEINLAPRAGGGFAWRVNSGSSNADIQIVGCPVNCGEFQLLGDSTPVVTSCGTPCP